MFFPFFQFNFHPAQLAVKNYIPFTARYKGNILNNFYQISINSSKTDHRSDFWLFTKNRPAFAGLDRFEFSL